MKARAFNALLKSIDEARAIHAGKQKPSRVINNKSLMETLDILADPKAMAGLRKGEEDIRKGRVRSWTKIRVSLSHPDSFKQRH